MSEVRFGQIDAKRLAALGTVQTYHAPLAEFPRIADLLKAGEGEVTITLRWHQQDGLSCCELLLQAGLPLVCQRCLRPFVHELRTESKLSWVADDSVLAPEGYEALLQDPHRVDCRELVQDELLLAWPLLSMHGEDSDCAGRAELHVGTEATEGEMRRPFAGLKDLMKH